jgi:hypothetical protein
MHACPRLNAHLAAQPSKSNRAASRHKRTFLAVVAALIGLTAWREFRLLLSQIPDSNDDFTYH